MLGRRRVVAAAIKSFEDKKSGIDPAQTRIDPGKRFRGPLVSALSEARALNDIPRRSLGARV